MDWERDGYKRLGAFDYVYIGGDGYMVLRDEENRVATRTFFVNEARDGKEPTVAWRALPLAITHAPGHMFVADTKDEELRSWSVPGTWCARPAAEEVARGTAAAASAGVGGDRPHLARQGRRLQAPR